jgi:hypothetical protein
MGGLNSGPHKSARLHEHQAKRFDVLELQGRAKAERWEEGAQYTLAFATPHTGRIISSSVVLTFTEEPFGGRRIWWDCPTCPRRVRYLYGGRRHISQPYSIGCSKCMQIARASNYEGPMRRWRRQIAKIEARLGGDPRKIEPPKGNARRTFDRLAQRHAHYIAKITAHVQEKLRRKLRNRPWPTDPAELRALREAFGLEAQYRSEVSD